MAKSRQATLEGVLWDETQVISLGDICRACGVQAAVVTEMVDYGIIEPTGNEASDWHFSGTTLRRVHAVVRLQRDLGLNLAGAALALDLLDELAELRRHLAAPSARGGSR